MRDSHVYKAVDGRDLQADVIGALPGHARPAVVWIHGGGLIFGTRTVSPRPSFLRALLERGIVVVSIDHRLAPETLLPGIVEDVQDAWRWVHAAGARALGIDASRVAIAGSSAGGYLSLLAGMLCDPAPRAIVSFWGYGDLAAAWQMQPSRHYRQEQLVTREVARAALAAPPSLDPALGIDRSVFYLYCRQQGTWLNEVTGHGPEHAAGLGRYCPQRHVTPAYPPTLLMHGTADTDVPYDASVRMAGRLARAGVAHRLVTLEGVGHGFAGAAAEVAEGAEAEAAGFLRAHL
jgi:acetyl esterase/lipase